MQHYIKSRAFKILAIILALALICPPSVSAAEPRASYYLSSYGAYVYPGGAGIIQVWFDVAGTGTMDEIGALSIRIYESSDGTNWEWVYTHKHNTTYHMLTYNDYSYVSHVNYVGTAGKYYKAYVCFWAGKDGNGDSRYYWTSAKQAT